MLHQSLYAALRREGWTDRPSLRGSHMPKGTSQGSSAPPLLPLFLSPPAAQSKQTQQQGQRMSLVKINHLCKGEWYGETNSAACITPQLKQTCTSSSNSVSPQSGTSFLDGEMPRQWQGDASVLPRQRHPWGSQHPPGTNQGAKWVLGCPEGPCRPSAHTCSSPAARWIRFCASCA